MKSCHEDEDISLIVCTTNVESVYITALILALIIDPAKSLGDLQFLGWAAILAMASNFRSMLKYLIDTEEPRDIVLFYANKTADEIAYTDVLNQAQTLPGIRVFYTLTDTGAIPRNWRGLTGRINDSMMRKLVPDYQERGFYLSGPPDMVRATEGMLKHMHVNPKQIKKDFFPGLV